MISRLFCLMLASFIIFLTDINAGESELDWKITTKPKVKFGNLYTATISREATLRESNIKILSLRLKLNLAEVTTNDYHLLTHTYSKIDNRDIFNLELFFYKKGGWEVGPIEYSYVDATGQSREGKTDSLNLEVTSNIATESLLGEVRFDPSQEQIEFSYNRVLDYLIAILLLLISGWLIFSYLKRRHQNALQAENSKEELPIDQESDSSRLTVAKLKMLGRRNLIREGEYKLFYLELSKITREHAKLQYGYLAQEKTLNELIADKDNFPGTASMADKLVEIVRRSDRKIFMRDHYSTSKEADELMEIALSFATDSTEPEGDNDI
ncbi:MAG: hypothetical protein ACN4E2_00175 [Nitrospinota bacterium]